MVGITGSEGFRAHTWLEGDPIPIGDDAERDPSVLRVAGGDRRTGRLEDSARLMRVGDGTLIPFNELLRRSARHYPRRGPVRMQ